MSKTVDGVATNYQYDVTAKDRLIAVGNQAIDYDAVGNPTTYKGNALTWIRGRLLSSFGNNSYTYNSAGIRTSKTVGAQVTNYAVSGDTILSETTNGVTTIYYHSVDGIIGFNRGGVDYYYRKNLQGDVTAILDTSGNVIAKYVYDAWGNHRIYDSTNTIIYESDNPSAYTANSNHIACLNPFRYRGYYFDNETGLYYLQSRYYDPQVGRFLNPDTIDYLEPDNITGVNLYTYCENNPVMYYDPNGHLLDIILDIGFIVLDIYNLFTNNGDKDWKNWVSLGFDLMFAMIPFVSGGGGQVIKLANVGDDLHDLSKVTVVGETMSRVKTVSQFVNATDNLYTGYQMYGIYSSFGKMGKVAAEVGGKLDNAVWLLDKLQRGYNIVDIGIDIGRGSGKILGRSSSYAMERLILGTWKNRHIIKFFSHLEF